MAKSPAPSQQRMLDRYDKANTYMWFGTLIMFAVCVSLIFLLNKDVTDWGQRILLILNPSTTYVTYIFYFFLLGLIIVSTIIYFGGDPELYGKQVMNDWYQKCDKNALGCAKDKAMEDCTQQFTRGKKLAKCRLGVQSEWHEIDVALKSPTPSAATPIEKQSTWERVLSHLGFLPKPGAPPFVKKVSPGLGERIKSAFKGKPKVTTEEQKAFGLEAEAIKDISAEDFIETSMVEGKFETFIPGISWNFKKGYNRFEGTDYYALRENGGYTLIQSRKPPKINGKVVVPKIIRLPRNVDLKKAMKAKIEELLQDQELKKTAELKAYTRAVETQKSLTKQLKKAKTQDERLQIKKELDKEKKKSKASGLIIPEDEEMLMGGYGGGSSDDDVEEEEEDFDDTGESVSFDTETITT
jgi:hypothetical protein